MGPKEQRKGSGTGYTGRAQAGGATATIMAAFQIYSMTATVRILFVL
jgi:hypothetical protein